MDHASSILPNPLASITKSANRILANRLVEACRRSASPARWIKLEIQITRHLDAASRTRPAAATSAACVLLALLAIADPASAAELACAARTNGLCALCAIVGLWVTMCLIYGAWVIYANRHTDGGGA
jgi:hypothetical protein